MMSMVLTASYLFIHVTTPSAQAIKEAKFLLRSLTVRFSLKKAHRPLFSEKTAQMSCFSENSVVSAPCAFTLIHC
jgi:hypothetical protein